MSPPIFATTVRRAAFPVIPHTSRIVAFGAQKRLYSSSVHGNDPDTIEREKMRNLSGKQHKTSSTHEYAPGWNEYLATNSEAAVKADKDGSESPDVLQKRSVEHIMARHHEDDVTAGSMEAENRWKLNRKSNLKKTQFAEL
ncbi:hypothetical protein PNOK_0765300 [Pyrrhoderma noxium]|uniref:Uncharacterized protein n=1 Tax=Pyrrhoderma noxium TaxID=2282107 RepID=A0A286U8Y0_9AGAM|nr:hypothetical protein PNOK_0765300 [Pyrrhoderma noxium]